MTLDLGELVGFLEMDVSRWDKGIDHGLRSLDEFGAKAKPRAQAAGTKAGQAFGDGLVPEAARAGEEAAEEAGDGLLTKGKVAAGVAGAAFGLAFSEALDIDAGRDRLAAQLGATARDSRMYGRIASELYSGAWGESMDHVNTSIASVVTSFEGMDEAGGVRIKRLTARALDFATAFEVDVVRATQVAGTMVSQGLARDGVRAFDLLTRASQKVPVALREDLLDATEEYGQFFSTLGYDGREAFALLVEASEKGMYGIDKAGDAIKEFTIRSTDMSALSVSAYELIGLSAEDMANKILKGGDDAREATSQVIDGLLAIEDPAERANAAIALFGTPIEDLNVRDIPDFLRSLQGTSDAMDDVAGAGRRMGDTLNDNAGTRIESFKRKMKTKLVDFLADEVIPVVEDDVLPAVERLGDWFTEDGGPALEEFHDDLKPVLGTVKDLVGWLEDLPKPAKYAGLVALLGGVGAMKLRGGGGGLTGGIGSALGLAKPVPVFVTNPGGLGGPGGPGGKPGKGGLSILPWIGPTAAYAAAAYANNRFPQAMPFGEEGWAGDLDRYYYKDGGITKHLDGKGTLIGMPDMTKVRRDLAEVAKLFDEADLPSELKTHIAISGVPESRKEVRELVETYDLTPAEKRTLFEVAGIEPARAAVGDLRKDIDEHPEQKGTDFWISGTREATQDLREVKTAMDRIQDKSVTVTVHTVRSGGGEVDFVSGGDRSATSGGKGRELPGGAHGRGVSVNIGQVVAHDYRDFVLQAQQRAQQASLGAVFE